MADYADLTQINNLYLQSQQVAHAINHLDGGGLPVTVTIAPPVGGTTMGSMAVTIPTPGPHTPEFIAQIRQRLVDRESDLATQLQALGVTATPPART